MTSQTLEMVTSEVADATAATITDQTIMITVSLPNAEQSVAVAKALVTELTNEIKTLYLGSQPLIRAEAMTVPTRPVSTGVGCAPSTFTEGVLSLTIGLVVAWGLASLRPKITSGDALAADERLMLRAEVDQTIFRQLVAVFSPRLKESATGRAILVGTRERVSLGS